MSPAGMGFSRKKITLSTSGHVPLIQTCADELGLNLAISLHAVNDELRNVLVPLNKRWNIKELMEACRYYSAAHPRLRITFEYVMLDGVNDSDADARALVRLIKGIPAKVNLIPFNPWHGTIYQCSSDARIESFAAIVQNAGYMSPVRTPRGRDILAACGQLKSDSEKKRLI
jgi:23S rRNA (adenine2503-C2)-methyltransferase